MAKALRDSNGNVIQCSQDVWGYTGFYYYKCSRGATVERNGKFYCTQHDPVRRAEKRQARNRQWKEAWDREQEARRKFKENTIRRIIACNSEEEAEEIFNETYGFRV